MHRSHTCPKTFIFVGDSQLIEQTFGCSCIFFASNYDHCNDR